MPQSLLRAGAALRLSENDAGIGRRYGGWETRMRIAIIGTGYVGLVTGVCFAETGNHVICVDKDADKIETLKRGELPIYELGLAELYHHNVEANRLEFTIDLAEAVRAGDLIVIAVGTPGCPDGSVDLDAVWAVTDGIADAMDHHCMVIVKSTVPVGTTEQIKERIAAKTSQTFDIANNPEFLKQGLAIDDFNKPDRVVAGVEREEVGETLRELYRPFLRSGNPMIITDIRTSEMIKYVSNAMLATKISFINEIANLCEVIGANIDDLRRGVCSDKRIGTPFMFPGLGYGGSCFPKDVPGLVHIAEEHGHECRILKAVHEVNVRQPFRMFEKMVRYFGGSIEGRTIAVWGVAYKAGTGDIRLSPSIAIVEKLLAEGASVRLHDPRALSSAKERLGSRATYCEDCYEALKGADALLVGTDWREYRSPDFERIQTMLKSPAIFDGRNIYVARQVRQKGLAYFGVGHAPA